MANGGRRKGSVAKRRQAERILTRAHAKIHYEFTPSRRLFTPHAISLMKEIGRKNMYYES
jgi:hypothetical protein